MTEEILQAQIFQYHWNNYPKERKRLFHVNNKAKNKIEGNQMKARGVVAGISDLVYLAENRTIYIELKIEGGVQSKEQKEFEAQCKATGHEYIIVKSLKDFLAAIQK
jgi:hypothetical protein